MREHLPVLLNKGKNLLRLLGHFVRYFSHFAGLGLVGSDLAGNLSGRPVDNGKITGRARNQNHFGYSTAEQVALPNGRRHTQPREGLSGASGIAGKISTARRTKNLIVSIHIPKTGGTTFVEVLRKCAKKCCI